MTSSSKARARKARRGARTPVAAPAAPKSPPQPFWTPALGAIVLVGLALRAYYIRQPMRYDESVTYLYFASQSWSTVVSSYTYPNNHVFHSLLVKACVVLLGNEPWVIRLPAFAAGVAMIPTTFLVGRRLFGAAAAYIAAALVAASGPLVFYSTNARGYTMICLATLVLGDLLWRLRERASGMLWSAVALVIALGAWTIPVMLYPAGGLMLWFVLSALRMDTSEPRADLGRVGLVVLASATLTVLLYSPILSRDGLTPVTGNAFVRAAPWQAFFRELESSVGPVLSSWTFGYPTLLSVAVGACVLAGVIGERKASGIRVSMAGAMYVWCALLLLATHRVPFFRVWLFLVAPLALLAGHGLVSLVTRSALGRRLTSSGGWPGLGVAAALSVVLVTQGRIETSLDTGTLRDAERIARTFSSAGLRPGDRVFAPVPSNAPLTYYFVRAGLDTTYLSSVPTDSARVFLVVNTSEGFTINTRLGDPLLHRFRRARLVAQYPSAELYQLF